VSAAEPLHGDVYGKVLQHAAHYQHKYAPDLQREDPLP
jgi:hypothetical protein